MRAGFFSASPGEEFSFTSEDGTEWKGTCTELRLVAEDQTQFRGHVRQGQSDLIDTEILGRYDQTTGTLEVIVE